jgi:hypothetical protein
VPWAELLHATGRLLSYWFAIRILINARRSRPELFKDYEVVAVPSSSLGRNPILNKCPSLEAVIGRMTGDPFKLAIFGDRAEEFSGKGLDVKLYLKVTDKNFHTIVHAEVLLEASLDKDGLTHPANFYKNSRYIGCSKPMCRLCEYYFVAKGSGFQYRSGHGNLYIKWRMPDVYPSDGKQAIKERETIANNISSPIRDDVFQIMRDRTVQTKRHDSNTEPTNPLATAASYLHSVVGDGEAVSAAVGELRLKERDDASDDQVSDDDEGGVALT